MAKKKAEDIAPEVKDNKSKKTTQKGAAKAEVKIDADKANKRKERLEKLKERPAVQRPNSRQIDTISTDGGSVETFGYAVRKTGSVVTTIAKNTKGEVVGVSTCFVPGVKVKVKKNHGILQPGVAGAGKKGSEESEDESEENED